MEYQTTLLVVTCVISAIILLIFIIVSKHSSECNKLPPGPRPFPIIGNILELGTDTHKALYKLSKTYGPIMTLKLGKITTIIISSPQVAKQVLHENGQKFLSRTPPHAAHAHDHHIYSTAWLPASPQWRNLRRVCATKVFSPQLLNSTQILRQQKLRELLDFVKERCKNGEVVDIGEAIFTTILNSISTTIFSVDLSDYSSENSSEFQNIFRGIVEELGRPNVADFFPFLRPIDPQRVLARTTDYFEKLFRIFHQTIEERISLRVSKSDVLDSLLNNITEEADSMLSRNETLHLFLDLFVAGVDTTTSTVEWIMAELLHSPDKMARLRKEICEEIDRNATLEESQLLKLPFLRAVVKETLRMHPPTPLLIPRKCDEMVSIAGFNVPKKAQILINVWGMGQDPVIWENPEVFTPERFMEREIDFKGHDLELIPFGAGKRICPGLPLADRTIHLLVATLVHNFEWKLADGLLPEHMDMNEKFGITLKKSQPIQVQPIQIKHC